MRWDSGRSTTSTPFSRAVSLAIVLRDRETVLRFLFLPELLLAHFSSVDIPFRVDLHPFDACVVVLLGIWLDERNERRHLAVSGAANPDAPREPRILRGVRLRVGDDHVVVPVDVHTARPAELLPLIEETEIGRAHV